MKDYKKAVQEYRKNRASHTISNASIDHAYVLFDNLLELAIEDKLPIKIVTGCLEKEFYNDLAEKTKKALDSGCTVEIIALCNKNELQSQEFVKTVSKHENGSIKILRTENPYHQQHFILVGDKSYRIEFSNKNKVAEANFNNELVGEFLDKEFKALSQRQEIFANYQ